jgi:membrane-associated phospholipid phosphatase
MPKNETMLSNTKIIFLLFSCSLHNTLAENSDSIYHETHDSVKDIASQNIQFPYRQLTFPASLIIYGTIETLCSDKFHLMNYTIQHIVSNHINNKLPMDDILQYVPVASMYTLDLIGIKTKNHLKDRIILSAIAGIFVGVTVNTIKYTTKIERPDKSKRNSFPSGHTATAFMGAEFLRQEYKDVSVWYGIMGYTVATGTGLLRMYNNRHWLGDVVAGAGIGILCTKLAYWIYPTIQQNFSKNRKSKNKMVLLPYYNGQQVGCLLSTKF